MRCAPTCTVASDSHTSSSGSSLTPPQLTPRNPFAGRGNRFRARRRARRRRQRVVMTMGKAASAKRPSPRRSPSRWSIAATNSPCRRLTPPRTSPTRSPTPRPTGCSWSASTPLSRRPPTPTRCSRPRPGLTRKAGRCSKRTCAHRAPRRSPYSGAFAATVDRARERIVVLDTAPTGHTLLLLDAAQSYQLEVKRTTPTCQPRSRSCSRARATPSSRGC
jgi:hypothetical protein